MICFSLLREISFFVYFVPNARTQTMFVMNIVLKIFLM